MGTVTRRSAPLVLLLSTWACARGLGGGAGSIPPGPSGGASFQELAGLRAAAAGDGTVSVVWSEPATALEVGLFLGTDRATLYQMPPVLPSPGETRRTLDGLANGLPYFLGLGLREPGAPSFTPAGVILSARPGPPIFVDAAADPALADGLAPGSAFPDLRTALLSALAAGGANLWVRAGRYEEAGLPLASGTHVYGGFPPDFDAAQRDLAAGTLVAVPSGGSGFGVQDAGGVAVLDGLALEGAAGAAIGIDASGADLELRHVRVRGFADRGVRLRNQGSERSACLLACELSFNGADGLSVAGPIDLVVDACRLQGNAQEGLEVDDLVALSGRTVRVVLSGSLFADNGTQGADIDLAAAFPPLPPAGAFLVDVRGCGFVGNGLDGLLVDQDHEAAPGWVARVSVRGSVARANGGNGIRFDADAAGSHYVEGSLVTANRLDGLRVDSEGVPGIVICGTSLLAGNAGQGMRISPGARVACVAHCVLAGNGEGGVSCQGASGSLSSSIAWLQPEPWSGVRVDGSFAADTSQVVFERVPLAYARVLAAQGVTLALDVPGTTLTLGGHVELDDDGSALRVVAVREQGVDLETEPAPFVPPASLAVLDGSAATDDLRTPAGSPAIGAGLGSSAAPVDAGVFGAPAAVRPGTLAEPLSAGFGLVDATPVPGEPLGAFDALALRFSAQLEPGSIHSGTLRALALDGAELATTLSSSGEQVLVGPPPAGWPVAGFSLVLQGGIASADGAPLHVPLALPYGSAPSASR